MRAEQLRDEVQRAVSTLAPQEREGFLKELLAHFPTWATANGSAGVEAAAPARRGPEAPGVDLRDPKVLVEKLIEQSRALSDVDRQQIVAKLKAAGLVASVPGSAAPSAQAAAASGPVPANAAAELRKTLGLGADAGLDSGKVTELAAVLAEFTLKLEPWACTYWRDVAPDAKNQVYQSLNKDLAKFLQGDEKTPREAIAKSAYRLRSLISLLMKGVTEAGKQFARDHMNRFSVEEISKAAGSGTLMTSKDVLCWKQYLRQMEGVDAAGIEKRLKSLLAKDVDAGLSQVIK